LAWSELKLGIVGVIALALAAALIFAIGGEGGFWTDKYPLKTRFLNIQGLKPGAVVWLGGKEIGQVSAVEFAGVEVEVTMEVLTDVRSLITTNSTASVGSLSLLGEPIIEIQASVTGTPPVSWPTASIFCDCRSCSSIARRSVRSRVTLAKPTTAPASL
jgi:phospholipid/cholesterol/gamma-HCH transport system substrate-binding protein